MNIFYHARSWSNRWFVGLSMTLGCIVMASAVQAANEIQTIYLNDVSTNPVQITTGAGTVSFAPGAHADVVKKAFETVYGVGNISVTGESDRNVSTGTPITVNGQANLRWLWSGTFGTVSKLFDGDTATTDVLIRDTGDGDAVVDVDFGTETPLGSFRIFTGPSNAPSPGIGLVGSTVAQPSLDSRTNLGTYNVHVNGNGWTNIILPEVVNYRRYHFVIYNFNYNWTAVPFYEMQLFSSQGAYTGLYDIEFIGTHANKAIAPMTSSITGVTIETEQEGGVPGAPTLSNVGYESIETTAPALPNGATSLTLQVKLATQSDSYYVPVVSGLSGSSTYTVTGLNSAATYVFRYIAHSPGLDTPGDTATETTLATAVGWAAGDGISCAGIYWPSNNATLAAGSSGRLSSYLATDWDWRHVTVGGTPVSSIKQSDTCSYTWSASGGSFKDGVNKGQSVIWIAPLTPGTYTINLVIDDQNSANKPPLDGGTREDASYGYNDAPQDFSVTIEVE